MTKCIPGKVTRGCQCVQCEQLRDDRLTYKQRRAKALRARRQHDEEMARHQKGTHYEPVSALDRSCTKCRHGYYDHHNGMCPVEEDE